MQATIKDRKIVLNRVRYAHKLFLLLDLDGTLLPAGSGTPRLKTKERELLAKIVALPDNHIGILSERPLEQVSRAVHVPGVHYTGNLGLDYAVPGGALIQLPAEEALARFDEFARELKRTAGKTRGITIDRLGPHISIDWSKAAAAPRKAFSDAIKELETSFAGAVRAVSGKQAADYLAKTGSDKGTAAVAVLRKVGFNLKSDFVVAIGDDVTNEDAFTAVAEFGVGMRVGRAKASSGADLTLKNVTEVWSFLQTILEVRSENLRSGLSPSARMF